MATKLIKIKYSKLLKVIFIAIITLLLFISGTNFIEIGRAYFQYGIPETTKFEESGLFAVLTANDLKAVTDAIIYGVDDTSRSAAAYQRYISTETDSINWARDNIVAIFNNLIWLEQHPPEYFYSFSQEKYLTQEEGSDTAIQNEGAQTTTNYTAQTTIPLTTTLLNVPQSTTQLGSSVPIATTSEYTLPQARKLNNNYYRGTLDDYDPKVPPEVIFTNYKYNTAWLEYKSTVVSAFYEKLDTALTSPRNVSAQHLKQTGGYIYSYTDSFSAITGFTIENLTEFYNKKLNEVDSDASYGNYLAAAENVKKQLSAMLNFKFAILNNNTGTIFSNFGTEIKSKAEIKDICDNEGLVSGSCTSITGLRASNDVFTNFLKYYPHIGGPTRLPIKDRADYSERELIQACEKTNTELYFYISDIYQEPYAHFAHQFDNLSVHFDSLVRETLILLLAAIILAIFLIVVAGKKSDGTLTLMTIDRLYHDIHLFFSGGAIALLVVACGAYSDYYISNSLMMPSPETKLADFLLPLMFTAGAMLALEFAVSVSRNIKSRHFIKQTLVYNVLLLCFKILKWVYFFIKRHYKSIKGKIAGLSTLFFKGFKKMNRSIVMFLVLYVGINFFSMLIAAAFMMNGHSGGTGAFMLLLNIVFNALVFYFLSKSFRAFDNIIALSSEIRNGNLNASVDIDSMPTWIRPFATDITENENGLRNAVADAVKNERMKAELITNVSHDLKTPLTAIVSYVSLLKQCEIKNPDAVKYILILDEKSDRLKNLIEDLVEASKATTGNIQFNYVNVNLNELTVQAVGENNDAFEEADIEIKLNLHSNEPVIVRADSQRTWRIIENLFANVKKYTMPHTRVYIDLRSENGFGMFSIKNISKTELNIPPEELMQRFVRGDEARGGEGSGLGLSIAKSLCELQHGKLEIEVDGDLFKATVILPLA